MSSQQELSLKYNIENIGTLIEPMRDSLLAPVLSYIDEWVDTINFNERPDLIEVVAALHELDNEQICWDILTRVLLVENLTIQACMGMFFELIGAYVAMPYRRGHVLNVYVEALCSSKLIGLEKIGKYNYLTPNVSFGDLGQKRYGYTLPSIEPINIETNNITGGRLKKHKQDVCLDHLQRLADVAYKVDKRILDLVKPVFDDTPKYKERLGREETTDEIEERYIAFKQFNEELPERINIMLANGNKFYIQPMYDTRLRTYTKAYHFDFIGNKYARAFVQPAKGELVNGANEYL